MDSFERIYRKNPFDYSRMFNPSTRMTVYSRCESLAQANGALGSAWTALKEAYYGEFSDKLLLLDYDIFTQFPEKSMQLVYEFLGVEAFSHDFKNVEYEESEFDQKLGVKGLHTVKKEVKFLSRKTVLPPDLFKKYSEMAFWQDNSGTNASIIAPKLDNKK
jgi:sulfotransferase